MTLTSESLKSTIEFEQVSPDLIGWSAAFCTTVCFVPQVVRCWQRRSAADVSLIMLLLMLVGNTLWITYALTRADLPIVGVNVATTIMILIMLAIKVRLG